MSKFLYYNSRVAIYNLPAFIEFATGLGSTVKLFHVHKNRKNKIFCLAEIL